MAEQRVERRLAAILAADVAGYSRLMGADEEGTLSRLDAHRREFLEPTVAEHNGRIVKRTGDGLLIEFGGAVDATRCATKRANQTRALAFRWSCKPPPCLAWVGPTRPRPRHAAYLSSSRALASLDLFRRIQVGPRSGTRLAVPYGMSDYRSECVRMSHDGPKPAYVTHPLDVDALVTVCVRC
jgi:class 3 adenylate cyclase